MTTATVLPDLGVSFAEKTTQIFEAANIEKMTLGEATRTIDVLRVVREVLTAARQSIEETLSGGVDAVAFAAKYDKAVTALGPLTETLGRIVAKTQAKLAPTHAKELASHFQALATDIASHREFLALAVAKAKAPAHPIDWQRVQQVESAYQRGEAKLFQRSSGPKH